MKLDVYTRGYITANTDPISIRVAHFELNETVKHSLGSAKKPCLTLNHGSDIENRRSSNP